MKDNLLASKLFALDPKRMLCKSPRRKCKINLVSLLVSADRNPIVLSDSDLRLLSEHLFLGGTLAHAFFPSDGRAHFDDAEKFTYKGRKGRRKNHFEHVDVMVSRVRDLGLQLPGRPNRRQS